MVTHERKINRNGFKKIKTCGRPEPGETVKGKTMLKHSIIIFSLAVIFLNSSTLDAANITPLTSPADFIFSTTTIDFDDAPPDTIANSRYMDRGVVFARDDGYVIPVEDWAAMGRNTTSSPNVIATVLGTFEGEDVPTWSTHLNLTFSSTVVEVGAYFGNDQSDDDYTRTTLSIFDHHNQLLGSVSVQTNVNTDVDQFIGLRSNVPFASARFDNNGVYYSVVLDDVSFAVPEPCTLSLLAFGYLAVIKRRHGFLKHE